MNVTQRKNVFGVTYDRKTTGWQHTDTHGEVTNFDSADEALWHALKEYDNGNLQKVTAQLTSILSTENILLEPRQLQKTMRYAATLRLLHEHHIVTGDSNNIYRIHEARCEIIAKIRSGKVEMLPEPEICPILGQTYPTCGPALDLSKTSLAIQYPVCTHILAVLIWERWRHEQTPDATYH